MARVPRSRLPRALTAAALAGLMAASGCSQASDLLDGGTTTSPGAAADGVPTASAPAGAPPTTPATVAATTTTIPPLDPTFDAIATRTAMTGDARALLARSTPVLVERGELAAACPIEIELSVLGCYASGRIAVLRVSDTRLDGMTEATTAHEMLHVAWAGLDEAERQRLGSLLQTVYAGAATTELTERIEAYRANDPTVVENELHSIVGTELSDIGPELEEYYRRWFTDRSAVVALAVASRSTFTSLERQVDELDAQLAQLEVTITDEEISLELTRVGLETRLAELEALKANGQIEEFNAGVDPFNQQVAGYNDAVAAHQALVDQHNGLVAQRNDLAAAYTDLVAQIDTSARSMPS